MVFKSCYSIKRHRSDRGDFNMHKKYLLFTFFVLILLGFNSVKAHEIHLEDGRVIQAKTCWEEDGFVLYKKFGTVVRLPRESVKDVLWDNVEVIKPATIYLKNGKSEYCSKSWEKDDKVYCGKYRSNYFYAKEDVAGVVKGKNHKFVDLPTEIQKRWTAATVYLKNNKYLHVNKVWTEGEKLMCQTDTDDFIFPIQSVKKVKKGHQKFSRRTRTASKTNSQSDRYTIGSPDSRTKYERSLEPIRKIEDLD